MKMLRFRYFPNKFWIAPALLLTAAAAVAASPTEGIRHRIAGYRALGAAFKTINDTIRSGDFQSVRLRQAAGQIAATSRAQYRWFPAGTGPSAGTKTAARQEIWSRAGEFRAAQDDFARQAAVFERTVASGDEAAIRSGARQLGAKCKACHDNFRLSDD
jgi:cytochrome c556